jgi:GT2 family glycosyltransferase
MKAATSSQNLHTVAIVIVAFEDWEVLEKCLTSIEFSTFTNYRLIVEDNSLSDIVERNISKKPNVDYHRTGHNLGFSRACNRGMVRALEFGADYVLLLNPDTELDTDCLSELIRCAESFQDVGIVAGKIHYTSSPDKIWYAGGKLSYLEGVGKHFKDLDKGVNEEMKAVTYATGCCMFIPSGVLKKTGYLKESIFMYLDDAEFCMRILSNGYKIYYNPKAVLAHAVGSGKDRRQCPAYYLYFSIRNKPLVAKGGVYAVYLHALALMLAVAKLLVYGFSPRIISRGEKLRAIEWAAWDSLFKELREEERFPQMFESKKVVGLSGNA